MDEKKCTNCIHFKHYYVKMKTRFYQINKGFCRNYKANGHNRRTDKICESYTQKVDNDTEKQQRLKYLKDYLDEVTKKLDDIKQD